MKRSEIYLTVDTLMNYPLCRSEYDLIPVENRFNPGVHWATMAPRFAPPIIENLGNTDENMRKQTFSLTV